MCIATRGCSGGNGSDDTRSYGVGSRNVGKELPRVEPVKGCPSRRTAFSAHLETFPACMFRGYLRVNHCFMRCSPHIHEFYSGKT